MTKAHHELGKRNPPSCVFLFPTRADLDPLREEMGFVFQGTYFFGSIRDNLPTTTKGATEGWITPGWSCPATGQ